ncbi:MAG: hypothetical protein JSW58_07390 [Candidatus Latescibacterota bacterium]|nr:MAG: hypothetical protein JSW58_07390 [Candidatus Latescibacterota bacterium]
MSGQFGLNDMVSWSDYQGVEGFGAASQNDVDQLNKALSAGSEINPPGAVTAGDGFALRVESLERTLKNTTYKMEHIKFWKSIPKLAAYNTVEEHNELSSYGLNPDAGFISEGDLPEEDDSSYERKFAIVKFLGTTRRVTHPMSLVRPAHGSVVANETVNGTMHLLRIMERALFYGDSSLSALQFDGFEKLLTDNAPATNIIDLRGRALAEDDLSDGALIAQDSPNFGQVNAFFLNPKTHNDLVKTWFPKERHNTFSDKSGTVGLDIKAFTSPAGDVGFYPNVFVNDGGGPVATAAGDATKRPGPPTETTGPTSPVEGTAKFGADDAGDYNYQFAAVNRYGRSAAVPLSGALTISEGDKGTFGITPGGATDVDWWEIYRSEKGGAVGSERLILRVPNGAGAAETIIDDLNENLPGTTSGFLFQMNLESMSFKQLAPMIKIPLATIDSSIRWMQLLGASDTDSEQGALAA